MEQNEETGDSFLEVTVISRLEMMMQSLKLEKIIKVKYRKEGIIHSKLSLGIFSFEYHSGHIKAAEKEVYTQHKLAFLL